jgi:hypothetical protein
VYVFRRKRIGHIVGDPINANALRHDFPASKIVIESVDVIDDQVVQSAAERPVQELESVDVLLWFVGSTHAAEKTSSEQ